MIKRFNTLIRAALMMLMLPVAFSALAQDQYWVNGIHYEVDYYYDYYYDGEGSPTGYNMRVIGTNGSSTYSGQITIPETVSVCVSRYSGSNYGGNYNVICRVTTIGEGAFRDCTGLTGISLPNSIKTIERNAFYGCSGLTSLTIPYGVKTIGESAFGYCTGLTSVTIPNSVTTLGWNVFYSCTNLTNVEISKSLTELPGTFHGCTSLTNVTIPGSVKKLEDTFNGCTSLTSMRVPKSVQRIEENTFAGCTSLTSIDLPNSLSDIESYAFAGSGLTSVDLPYSMSMLGNNVFAGCTNLTSVTSRCVVPPSMRNSDIFDGETYGTAALYVPASNVDLYRSYNYWGLFENIQGREDLNTYHDFLENGIYYLITGPNTVSVTSRNNNLNSYSGSVTIPASVTHEGVTYNVTAIGVNAFHGCTSLTAVSMPASITSIDFEAFNGCSALTSINIPEAVTTIGFAAFNNCSSLTSLTIPVNVVTIGEIAFSGTTSLTSLTWNARECWTNGGMATSGITSLTIGDEVRVLPQRLAYNSPITSVDIPLSVTHIGDEAFCGCTQLTALTIPLNVIEIGTNSFSTTSGLTSLTWNARKCWTNGLMATSGITDLTIGNEVQVIPSRLAYNSPITSVDIPQSVSVICRQAFYNCDGLTSIVIPDGVTAIGFEAFAYNNNVQSLTIGKGVTMLDWDAFAQVPFTSLTWNARRLAAITPSEYYPDWGTDLTFSMTFSYMNQVTFGDEVEFLPDGFGSSSRITSLNIPATLTSISNYCFKNCGQLTSINLPETFTTIGDGCFKNCGQLTSISLPESITSIGADAFSECRNLTGVQLPGSLTRLGTRAFYNCNALTSLFVPASLTSFGKWAFNKCGNLETIVVDSNNPVYDSRENCNIMFKTANDSIVLIGKNATLPNSLTAIPDSAFYGHTEITQMVIPASVTYIGKDAFNACSNLTSITLPAALTQIGDRAFSFCRNLTSVTLPPSLTQIGDCAFMVCSKLTSITIPAATTQIGERAFGCCSSLESITVEGGNTVYDSRDNCNAIIKTETNTLTEGCLTSVIPSTVKNIGRYAFYGRSPSWITIPDGVESVDSYAYYQCGVDSIYFGETVKTIGYSAFGGCSNLRKITLGNSVETLGNYAFTSCERLADINLGNSLVTIGDYAFRNCMSSSYSNPDGNPTIMIDEYGGMYMLIYIEEYDDYYYTSLNYDHYCDAYFYYNWYGEEIWISADEVEQLMNSQTGSIKVIIPASVKTIGNYAFNSCSGLGSVVMSPNSVTTLGNYAFGSCLGLKSVVIPESLKTVGYGAFYECSVDTVSISNLKAWCDIDFESYNSNPICGRDGLYLNGEKLVDLVIPEGVTAVKKYAFSSYKGLRSATIGNSVKSIGYEAFDRCSNLKRVDIGDSVDSIAGYSFPYCTSLDTVTLGASVRSMGYMTFYNVPIKSLTSLAITPPVVTGSNPFTCYSTAKLYVPQVSVEAYKAADIWKKFTMIEGIPGTTPGDMNGDGQLSVSDITMLINAILGAGEEGIDNPIADLNGDGTVNISDIVMLIDLVMHAQ